MYSLREYNNKKYGPIKCFTEKQFTLVDLSVVNDYPIQSVLHMFLENILHNNLVLLVKKNINCTNAILDTFKTLYYDFQNYEI